MILAAVADASGGKSSGCGLAWRLRAGRMTGTGTFLAWGADPASWTQAIAVIVPGDRAKRMVVG